MFINTIIQPLINSTCMDSMQVFYIKNKTAQYTNFSPSPFIFDTTKNKEIILFRLFFLIFTGTRTAKTTQKAHLDIFFFAFAEKIIETNLIHK